MTIEEALAVWAYTERGYRADRPTLDAIEKAGEVIEAVARKVIYFPEVADTKREL